MESDEVLKMIWEFKKRGKSVNNIHIYCGNITDGVIKQSMKKMSSDNVTAIFISFQNFENKMKDEDFEYKINPECKYIGDEFDLNKKIIL